MRTSGRLQAILVALDEIAKADRPADGVLSAFFRSRRYIGSKDRAEIAEAVYEVLRRQARLTWWLEKYGHPVTPRGRVLTNMALNGESFEDIAAHMTGGQYAPETMTEAEEKYIRGLKGHTLFHPHMPEAVSVECPDWAEAALRAVFGPAFKDEMAAMIDPAPLDLRINPIKIDRDGARRLLSSEKITAKPTDLSPLGLRVSGRPQLALSRAFKEGFIEIQDEGSQLLAQLVGAKPGMQVVDFCAGAGGKTLAIAAEMANKGRVIACDIMEKRLARGSLRFRRAGLFNIETRVLTSEKDPWVKRHKGMFDRVLVDAPCSGVGVWRRNPDSRWRFHGLGLGELVPLQASILESAARLVKAGGRLIYGTCSLLPDENAKQVEAFLAKHPDFKLVPCGLEGKDHLMLTPRQHNTDGFFGAVMERSANAKVEAEVEA